MRTCPPAALLELLGEEFKNQSLLAVCTTERTFFMGVGGKAILALLADIDYVLINEGAD